MAQQSQKVIVTLDQESKTLMRRIANALEKGNKLEHTTNVFESHNSEPKTEPEIKPASKLEIQDALLNGGMIMIDVGNLIRVLNNGGLHIYKKTE